MKKTMKFFVLICFSCLISACTDRQNLYSVSSEPWPESLGNHRAVLEIEEDAEAALIDLTWRRHDLNPQKRRLLIISASSGDTISNIHRIRVDAEKCEILAGPVTAGTYYFYYLPFEVQEGYGFYNKGYLSPEDAPDDKWLEGIDQDAIIPAVLRDFEARTAMDNFFPMEIIPLASEKKAFLEAHSEAFLLFTEDRKYPVRMWDEIPMRWIEDPKLNYFEGSAQRNEYYVFQVALYANGNDIENLQISYSDFDGPGAALLEAKGFTCFNTEGVDTYGKAFQKEVDIRNGRVQALWIGVDIPEDIRPGHYEGKVSIGPAEGEKQEVSVKLKIGPSILSDRGDSEPWRHSRLRWLNSRIGLSEDPVAPYTTIQQSGDGVYTISGKKITVGTSGLPESILLGESEVLKSPLRFRILDKKGDISFSEVRNPTLQNRGGIVRGKFSQDSESLQLSGEGSLESDGYLRYQYRLKAIKDINLGDVRLEIPFRKEIAQYMMGMGLPGTSVPDRHQAKWKGPEDSFWIGNTRGGLWVELRGSSYHGPLLNLYHPEAPQSWSNQGRGGFEIESKNGEVLATVSSGEHKLKVGDELSFEFAMLITPVKELNLPSQFIDRYFHNSAKPDPDPEDLEAGIKIVNLHHANSFNPIINYPFIEVDVMKAFVDRNHALGLKVKIYYTIRELSNHLPELWALRSLQGEIFDYGPAGGYPWLREHLLLAYRHQWYDHSDDTRVDASLLTAPGDSRWINYYLEGLAWLIGNVGIDGLYMDDVSFDRHIMKRIRNVLESEKEGCIIDLHSNTGFSKGPATQYAEYFPYVDKLWFGESFMYDEMSAENWLVEVSGLPFGLMGDMLHGGGNPWLGMVFGMTARLPWSTEGVTCNPKAIWKIWDEFKIDQAKMSGFWDLDPVVESSHPKVKSTSYLREQKVLISVGNFSDMTQKVSLQIDWEQVGFGPENVRLSAPEIENFQEFRELSLEDLLEVESRKGFLLYLEPI